MTKKRLKLYHGTRFESARDFKIRGAKAIRIPKLTQRQIKDANFNRYVTIGSLGIGFYTFLDDPELAYAFIQKFSKGKKVIVFELEAEVSEDNLLVLDYNTEDMKRFNTWIKMPEVQNSINFYEKHKIINGSKQKSLDGILIELYCRQISEVNKINIDAVEEPTHTSIDGINNSGIINGIEVLIRNKEIIIENTFKEYKFI